MNIRRGGELMEVDMLLLDVKDIPIIAGWSQIGMLIWAQPHRVSPNPVKPSVTLTLIYVTGFKKGWP
ncbi:hypothetical protein IGI04_006682 [Brassica rapa subsp. trilocularis]|uniref:Isopenicillin N synthase-like Fe(2+) 2OG dioxygenase domain-containing protein n=1 Tax=Brassica rapa subsp. trilocularis TaxID=1813537 RepID=A0ABQ7NHL3_BRACM|nr:hypothetical protein IGI04_006682 [Brassica rapa subsp. trilocularis]